VFFWLSLAAAVVAFVVAGFATKESSWDDWAERGLSPFWIGVSLASLAEAVLSYLCLETAAVIVRLLKKQTDVPFSGEIR